MKHPSDTFTLDMLDKPRRGRPRKPDALTPAERARRYRAKLKAIADVTRAASTAAPCAAQAGGAGLPYVGGVTC